MRPAIYFKLLILKKKLFSRHFLFFFNQAKYMYIILQQNVSISNFIVMALKTTGVACFLEEGRRINVYLFLAV